MKNETVQEVTEETAAESVAETEEVQDTTEPAQEETPEATEEKEAAPEKEKKGFFSGFKSAAELEKTKKKLGEAEAALEKAQKEKDEYMLLLQRNQADFENFRRRNNSVRAESIDTGRREVILEMLPALDDFERVLAEPGNGGEAFVEGVRLVYKKFSAALEKLGLAPLEDSGKFDPNLHNAILSEKAEGVEPETILQVFQKGYKVSDKIIRHSMVKVSE